MNRVKSPAWLCLATLIGIAVPGVGAVRAEDCACSSDPSAGSPKPSTSATPTPPPGDYRFERVGGSGVKIVSTNNSYAITLTGSNAQGDLATPAPTPGEVSHQSVDAEIEGRLGQFFNLDLQSNFTDVKRDAGAELFSLQPVDASGENRRSLEKFNLKTDLFDQRITFSSSRLSSNFIPLASNGNDTKGVSEQDRFNALLWSTDRNALSIEGRLSRVDADYQDLTNVHTTDPFQAKNRETSQLKSNLKLGWASFYVADRNTAALIPDKNGDSPHQSEIETGISVSTSSLHDMAEDGIGHDLLGLLPDSLWVSTTRGSVEHTSIASLPDQTQKSAIGFSRNWKGGELDFSYWKSTLEAVNAPNDPLWRGQGMDFSGNVGPGQWSLSGNVSWYQADGLAVANTSVENSLNGSVFLNWRPIAWPKLSAGITNYAYQADFFDYNGAERNSTIRYQLMIDGSPLISSVLDDKAAKLSFLASFDGNKTRSDWSQSNYSNSTGNLFFGLRLARPILP